MNRISTPLVALALCLSLVCLTLPRARAAAPDVLPKKEAKQGESCATCPSGNAAPNSDWMSKLAAAGRRTQQMPFLPVQRSVFDGVRVNFVSTANGGLAFAATDLRLSGLMPLSFVRVYASDRAEDRGIGAGWSFAYDDRIRMTADGAVLSTSAGAEIAFRRDAGGGRFVLSTPQPGLHQSFEEAPDGTLTESAADLTRTYQRVGGEYRLARIADQNGNAIQMSFDRRGNLARVEGLGGQSLTLTWAADKPAGKSAGKAAAVKQARLLSVADSAGRRVSFAVRAGQLASVVDQAGSQWGYEYAGGRLVGATDPLGRAVLRASYDSQGRVVESGDAVGSHRFEYGDGGRTVVTDPLGVQTTFTHTALGAVASVTDDEGQTATMEYDGSNRPVRASDSLGNQQTFQRKAENMSASGSAAGYRSVRNGRGQTKSLKIDSGLEVAFEYDAAGNATALNYSDMGRFETSYDGAGRRVSERLPSGRSYDYKYDAHGQVARVSDYAGRVRTFERDASGLLARVAQEDGRSMRVTRDAAGRITRLDASDGKSRQYAYDARGSLTYYRDAQGRQYSMSYDRRGRLQQVDKSDGVTFRFRYGRDGRLASVNREVRGQAPSFTKANFNLSPSLAAFRDNLPWHDCFAPDGWWLYMWCNPCDPFCVEPMDWGGFGIPTGGVSTMSEEECRKRAWNECRGQWEYDAVEVLGWSAGILIACVALVGWTGVGILVCGGVAVVFEGMGLSAANAKLDSCLAQKYREICPALNLQM